MAKRNRRADEVIPKLHYRPGVDDPDLEATIVGFYGTRQEGSLSPSIPRQPIDKIVGERAADTVAVKSTGAVSVDETATVATVLRTTVSEGSETTVTPDSPDTIAVDSADTVCADPTATVALGTLKSAPTVGDIAEEPGGRPYYRTLRSPLPDTVSVELSATVAVELKETVTVELPATVAITPPDTVAGDRSAGPLNGLWYTEGKEGIFPAQRIRRIVLAQDALTHAEESVYDVLWGPKNQNRDEHRLTSIGYDSIAKSARVTKMNAKWIVERLIHKGFAKVETLPDPLRRIPTCYRVFGYRAALEDMRRRNRYHIVRTGNGVLFAHPLSPTGTVAAGPANTIFPGQTDMAADEQTATVSRGQADTVPRGSQATVAGVDTPLDSTSEAALIQVISTVSGQIIGNDAAVTIVSRCRAQAPDFTHEELADIAKAEAIKAMREKRSNLTGWLITVLPGRFAGESFRIYRETQQKLRDLERQEQEAQAQRWRQILEDPTESEELKTLAREVLGIEQGREETK